MSEIPLDSDDSLNTNQDASETRSAFNIPIGIAIDFFVGRAHWTRN